MAKKAIKGFSALRMWPVTTNTATAYVAGAMALVPAAQKASVDRKTNDYSIPADDGVYDRGTDFDSDTLQIETAELTLALMASLDGATFDAGTGVYTWGNASVAPEIALGFRALTFDGNYRMVQYYCAKVTSIKVNYTTREPGKTEVSSYTIIAVAVARNLDGNALRIKDTTTAGDLVWLDTLDGTPDFTGGVLVTLVLVSTAGTATGSTAIALNVGVPAGHVAKYKTAATVTLPILDELCTTGWLAFTAGQSITATTGHELMVAYIDVSTNKAKGAGKITVVSKA